MLYRHAQSDSSGMPNLRIEVDKEEEKEEMKGNKKRQVPKYMVNINPPFSEKGAVAQITCHVQLLQGQNPTAVSPSCHPVSEVLRWRSLRGHLISADLELLW